MNSQEFIKNQIDKLVAQFPTIQVRYEYDGDHIIEILPAFMLNEDEAFQDAISDLYSKYENGEREDLLLVTEDDIVRVENVTYQKTGSQFVQPAHSATH